MNAVVEEPIFERQVNMLLGLVGERRSFFEGRGMICEERC